MSEQAVDSQASAPEQVQQPVEKQETSAQEKQVIPPGFVPLERVNKLTGVKYQQIAENQQLKKRIAELEAQSSSVAKLTQPVEPTLEDSEWDKEAHEKALSEWQKSKSSYDAQVAKQSLQDEVAKQLKDREHQAMQAQAVSKFSAEEDKYAEANPDYYNDISKLPNLGDNLDIVREAGPSVAHHLGKNPDIALELSGMNRVQAAMKLGILSASLATIKTSNAPEPAPTLGGGTGAIEQNNHGYTIGD